ncbi:MAG: hypothetical protein AAFU79_36050, partial [Myxococcota bacterium]
MSQKREVKGQQGPVLGKGNHLNDIIDQMMSRRSVLKIGTAGLFTAGFAACGEDGAVGPQGAPGTQGPAGPAGP